MFSFSSGYQVETVSELRMGARVYFFQFQDPIWCRRVGPCASFSLCVFILYIYPVGLEGLVPRCPSSARALTLFLPPLLKDSLRSEERDLMETSISGLRVPRPLTLCILSGCVSGFVPIC